MEKPPVVIVTGASRGMGAETSVWLASAGAFVALVARSEEGLMSVADRIGDIGGHAKPVVADVSNVDDCRKAVSDVLKITGEIAALVNNAGELAPLAPVSSADPAEWRQNIQVNLMGPFFMIQSALPALRISRGRIINVSSGAATSPTAAWSAYCAAKAGLNHLSRVLALEEPEVTTISIRPGAVDTAMQARIRQEGPRHMASDKIDLFQRLKKENNLLPPEIPGRSIAWLALKAPKQWSGLFLNHDQEEIVEPAEAFFKNLKSCSDTVV